MCNSLMGTKEQDYDMMLYVADVGSQVMQHGGTETLAKQESEKNCTNCVGYKANNNGPIKSNDEGVGCGERQNFSRGAF